MNRIPNACSRLAPDHRCEKADLRLRKPAGTRPQDTSLPSRPNASALLCNVSLSPRHFPLYVMLRSSATFARSCRPPNKPNEPHDYERSGDAMRYLNVEGNIAWRASPWMLSRLADAEREVEDDMADFL